MKPALTLTLKATAAIIGGYITFVIVCASAATLWLIRNGYTKPGRRHGGALTTP